MKVLRLDSDWDSSTLACAEFRTQEFLASNQFPNFEFVTRRGSTVLKDTVSVITQDPDILFITAQGHGTPTFFTGHGGESIWSTSDIDQMVFTGKIVHLLSCYTASSLGPEMRHKGAKAFFGYQKEFRFLRTEPALSNPLDDPIIKHFLNVACEVDRGLLSGLRVSKVHQNVLSLYESAVNEWLPKNQDVAGRFLWNKEFFRSPMTGPEYGNTDAALATNPIEAPSIPVSPVRIINSGDHDWPRPIAYDKNDNFIPLSHLWDTAVQKEVKSHDLLTSGQIRELVARRVETASPRVTEETLNKADRIRKGDPTVAADVDLEMALVDHIVKPVLRGENMNVRVAETELNRPLALDVNKKPVALKDYKDTIQSGLSLSLDGLDDTDREKLVLARYEFFEPTLTEAQLHPISAGIYSKDQLIGEIKQRSSVGMNLIQLEMLLIAKIQMMIDANQFNL
jgi:hypothetical protein